MSRVTTCHMSHVIFFIFFFLDKVVKLVGGGSVINGTNKFSLQTITYIHYILLFQHNVKKNWRNKISITDFQFLQEI